MMMIVYWYSFSNHYTRECIHTCERERTCGSSQSSPGFMLAPSSWCWHALHAHHPPSPPCLVSSQAGFGMQCYSPLQTRTLGPPWSVRGLLMKSYLNLIHVRPSRLLVFVVGACPCCLPRGKEKEIVVYWYSFSNPRTVCIHYLSSLLKEKTMEPLPPALPPARYGVCRAW